MMGRPESLSLPNEHMVLQILLELCIRGGHDGFSRTPILYGAIYESNS